MPSAPLPLVDPDLLQELFDRLPDVVFFIKDRQGRYTHANQTLVQRLGLGGREAVIGRGASELFPARLGDSYSAQDRRVLAGGRIDDQLEMHMFQNRAAGWCLTSKQPLWHEGEVLGLIGISRDLAQPDGRHPGYARLRRVLDHMEAHYGEPVRMQALAELAGLSLSQLERQFRRVFQLAPQQWLTRLRIEAAMQRLHGEDTIAAIGHQCGFTDQSAFSRQFKASVGLTPRDYRRLKPAPPCART
ncbi:MULTISPECIES: AraC family transcriptional regulator [unclassified Lysobacter]|uniref:AraC family transcriptional regulator n=1 Tax=unclassified Lysobacter TaxID=2635362 RepID=UPI0007099F0B|nr:MULTISPECIES: AraC family transcriptional regulator [unclassified Lysobacter]KRD72464.1 AraC family transcriptional regulator [Lysobacter sp. Root983]SFL08990.1 PAS domain S-box-containing protein [Lysobacter sp. cf310]